MNSLAVVVGSVVLSAAVGGSVALLVTPGRAGPEESQAAAALAVRADVDRLLQENRLLREQLDRLLARQADAPSRQIAVPQVSEAQLVAAVARYMEQRGGGDGGEAAAAPAAPTAEVETLFAQIQAEPRGDHEALWAKAREAGVIDDLVARFEAFARANPNIAQAQVDAGMAYVQKLLGTTSTMEQSALAIKADGAFDRALDIDERHWGARFAKAVSYTFWPPVFGKGQEAIGHFETLVEQQEAGPPQPQFAQTYLLLGNMYAQQGEQERAQAIWKRGRELFPQDAALRSK